ncbi:MAG: VCBS repeat-containing protein [Pseudomonadales bacterium]|nr:VCBS repeat-containing protein [Pseudomonadales bacterium]
MAAVFKTLNYEAFQNRNDGTIYLKPIAKTASLPAYQDIPFLEHELETPLKLLSAFMLGACYVAGNEGEYIDTERLVSDYSKIPLAMGDFYGDDHLELLLLQFNAAVPGQSRLLQIAYTAEKALPQVSCAKISPELAFESMPDLKVLNIDADPYDELLLIGEVDGEKSTLAIMNPFGFQNITAGFYNPGSNPETNGSRFTINPADLFPAEVGAIGGDHSVGADGSAAFSIPLSLPAAAGGLKPALGLSYNSNGANGTTGYGWSLSGESRLHRCGKSKDQDGVITGIAFDNSDKLCLDGQRLILMSGAYGTAGSVYHLENESFTKIVAASSMAGSMPESFTVYSSDGGRIYYGTSSDSRIEGNGPHAGEVMEWALSKTEDRFGTYQEYSYNERTDLGEYQLQRIEYGANDNAGIGHVYRVELDYVSRPDVYVGYLNGSHISNNQLLQSLSVYEGDTNLRFYSFEYEVTGINQASYLKRLTECSGAGFCLQPTEFTWGDSSSLGLGTPVRWQNRGDANVALHSGDPIYEDFIDLNNDGLVDRLHIPFGKYDLFASINTGSGFTAPFKWLDDVAAGVTLTSVSGSYTMLSDVNGDALPDRIWFPYGSPDLYVALNNGSGFEQPTIWLQNSGQSANIYSSAGYYQQLTDVDADGLPDWVWIPDNKLNEVRVALNTGSSFATPVTWLTQGTDPADPLLYAGDTAHQPLTDMNGDGLLDWVWIPYQKTDMYVALNNGSGFESPSVWLAYDSSTQIPLTSGNHANEALVDLTGDGLPEWVWIPSSQSHEILVSINDGTQLMPPEIWLDARLVGEAVYSTYGWWKTFTDVNDDGFPDHVWLPSGSSDHLNVALSTGRGFQQPIVWQQTQPGDPVLYSSQGQYEAYVDVNGDGMVDRAWMPNGDDDIYVALSQTQPFSELKKVTNGFGHETVFTYKPMTDNSVYKKGDYNETYPMNGTYTPYQKYPARVVSRIDVSNGMGGYIGTEYQYEGRRVALKKQKDLGFRKMIVTNPINNVRTETVYSQDHANDLESSLLTTTTIAPDIGSGEVVMSNTTNDWVTLILTDGADPQNKRFMRQLNGTTVIKRDLDGSFLGKEVNTYTYNDYGHLLTLISKTYDAANAHLQTRTTINTYTHNTTDWILGMMTSSRVISDTTAAVGYNPPLLKKVSAWAYNTSTGAKTDEYILKPTVANPESFYPSAVLHQTTYSNLDAFGNPQTVTVSGPDFTTRSSSQTYDATGRFVLSSTNALGHTSSTVYYDSSSISNGAFPGQVKEQTDINGQKVFYRYDAMGRAKETIAFYGTADEVTSTSDFFFCDGGCPANAIYYVQGHTEGGVTNTTYMDQLGRELRKSTQSLDGSLVYIDYQYDADGRNIAVSEPYFAGTTPLWNTVVHDAMGRMVSATQADGRVDTVTYNGLTNISHMDINGKNQSKTTVSDSLGNLVSVTDNDNNTLGYEYDSLGNMTKLVDPDGNTTLITYNELGQKDSMDDPDKGYWRYAYNGLGQLITQKNARGEVICMAYDILGRKTKQVDNFGGSFTWAPGQTADSINDCANPGTWSSTATWVYDTAPHPSSGYHLGKLHSMALQDSNEYQEVYSYDSYCRVSQVDYTLRGDNYSVQTSYDSLHRPDVSTYPSGFAVKNNYNSLGFLDTITNNSTSEQYYEAVAMDARGNMIEENYGAGITSVRAYNPANGFMQSVFSTDSLSNTIQDMSFNFDAVGNLIYRADAINSFTENFTYDNLNRLTQNSADFGNNEIQQSYVTYDALGNILTKTGTGTYQYGSNCSVNSGNGYGPHAVCRTDGAVNSDYTYDANGNMLSGSNRSITWSAFDKPVTITKTKAGVTNTTEIRYNPNRSRYYRKDNVPVQGVAKITEYTYVGPYEKAVLPDGKVEERHYIGGFAVYTQTDRGTANETDKLSFMLKDHLGSITTIADTDGNVQESMSFDPWGKRRAPTLAKILELAGETSWSNLTYNEKNNLTFNAVLLSSAITNKGFTGHEQMDPIGLIHMNGRVYDAQLGRFISADPFVSDTTNLQGLNRYSYVENNPLSYTDPSGYFLKKLAKAFKKAFKAVRKAVKAFVNARVKAFKEIRRFTRRALSNPVVRIVVAVVVSVLTGGFAGDLVYAAMQAGFSCTQAGLMAMQVASIATGGAVAGFVSGGIMTGTLKGAMRGAAAGLVTAGVAGYYGDTYTFSRVLADGAANGVASELSGGSFKEGLRMGLTVSMATYVNMKLRAFELEHSRRFTEANQVGQSRGHRGLVGKLTGGRINQKKWEEAKALTLFENGYVDEGLIKKEYAKIAKKSLLGGYQYDKGSMFNIPYDQFGVMDYVGEAFAGVHDGLNHMVWYNSNGTSKTYPFFKNVLAEGVNYSNVVVAAPIAIASMMPDHLRFMMSEQYRRK